MKSRLPHKGPRLRVEDLVVRYYKKDVIRGASLDVAPGEVVALIGANGSGKSTLLKGVGGVLRPAAGRVWVDGLEVTGREAHELAHIGVGFLAQGGVVFPSLTVGEHLQLAMDALRRPGLAARAQLAWETFPRLAAARRKPAGLLSGGERQMLGLAMLLVQDSKLWLLDEPTASLDSGNVEVLLDYVLRTNREEGVTILVVEQNLKAAMRIAGRVYVIKDGLAHECEAESLLTSNRLEELFFAEVCT